MKDTITRLSVSGASLGLSAFALVVSSALVPISAQALVIPVDFNQWKEEPVEIGNLRFTYESSDILTSNLDTLNFSFNTINGVDEYLLVYNFGPPSIGDSFLLDYTVEVIDKTFEKDLPDGKTEKRENLILAVDSDSTVPSSNPPAENLQTEFLSDTDRLVILNSVNGSSQIQNIWNSNEGEVPFVVSVSNTYNSFGGGPIFSFQNSFRLTERLSIIDRRTPEPNALIGLLALGGIGVTSWFKKGSISN